MSDITETELAQVGEWREDARGWHYEGALSRINTDHIEARLRVRGMHNMISLQHPGKTVMLNFYNAPTTTMHWDKETRQYTTAQIESQGGEKFRISILKG